MESPLEHLNVTQVRPLPSPAELLHALPCSKAQKAFVVSARNRIRCCLHKDNTQRLMIVGPCSMHDPDSAKEYAGRLHQLSEEVSDTFCVVMRIYCEKARTSLGWKGFLYDPYLDCSHDIAAGLQMTRQLLLEMADLEVPVATEFLDPVSAAYFGDLISWGCIGARTVTSQIHRQLASMLPMPVGFKNNVDGNVEVAIHAIQAASKPHSFLGISAAGQMSQIRTPGNLDGHVVLRGGESGPNYTNEAIVRVVDLLRSAGLPEGLLVDCSHNNTRRKHEGQVEAFQSVIQQIVEGNTAIRGLLLESHLYEGNQALNSAFLKYGVSVTDSCLGWEATEQLIRWAQGQLEPLSFGVYREEPLEVAKALL